MKFLTSLVLLAGAVFALPAPSQPEWLAPIREPVDGAVGNRWLVMLKQNHTLEEHFKTIGVDLSKETEDDFKYFKLINTYGITLPDRKILEDKIRHDPGVKAIEGT